MSPYNILGITDTLDREPKIYVKATKRTGEQQGVVGHRIVLEFVAHGAEVHVASEGALCNLVDHADQDVVRYGAQRRLRSRRCDARAFRHAVHLNFIKICQNF